MDLKEIETETLLRLNSDQYEIIPAIRKGVCQRCAGTTMGVISGKLYCRQCVNFGRLDEASQLIIFNGEEDIEKQDSVLRWQGKLSELQEEVSHKLCAEFLKQTEHLLWAVTGAGKTEILFATVDKALQKGLRVAIVSPRVDVCEELYPRFCATFDTEISLMHGQKEDELKWTQLTIATVHQLLKFRAAFDVIIVDEVDSFPLFGDAWLQEIMYRSLKSMHHIIYLSATPPKQIQKRVDRIYYLPQRFHGKPLPVPQARMLFGKQVLPKKLLNHIRKLIEQKQRFLMFFPSIELLKEFGEKLRQSNLKFEYELVSSQNKDRLEIVQKFRDNQLFALFTTTILERGVTFNDIDVIVYRARHSNFSKEVLIQIAGRAGRQVEHYDNEVTFYYFEYHRQIKTAITEIKKLNKLAEDLL